MISTLFKIEETKMRKKKGKIGSEIDAGAVLMR